MTHLPPLPSKQDNLLAQLLVSPDTASELCWSLLDQVDPHSTIDGKPLLQVFCEKRAKNYSIWPPSFLSAAQLPLSNQEKWPNPLNLERSGHVSPGNADQSPAWPQADMWVAAHLICNGPDPLSWKTTQGNKDVFDFVVQWQNHLLLDQLLRLPNAPPAMKLALRRFGSTEFPWMHACARDKLDKMVEVLLRHGFPVNQPDSKGRAPLHVAVSPNVVSSLLAHGGNPFAVDKAQKTILQTWLSAGYEARTSQHSTGISPGQLEDQIKQLNEAAIAKNKDRAQEHAIPALFNAVVNGQPLTLPRAAAAQFDLPLENWMLPGEEQPKSLLYAMAIESTRKKKSPLVNKICTLLEELPPSARDHVSTGDIPDLAFCWMAITRYGDILSDSLSYRQKLLSVIQQEDSPVETHQKLWRIASHLDGGKSSHGAKVNEAVSKAWSNEIVFLHDEMRQVSISPSFKAHRLEAVIQQPDLLSLLAKMPWDTHQAQEFLCRTIRQVHVSNDPLGSACLLATVSMVQNPKFETLGNKHMTETLGGLLNEGALWDQALPGAPQALLDMASFAQENPELQVLAAHLQAMNLQMKTPHAQTPRTKSRL